MIIANVAYLESGMSPAEWQRWRREIASRYYAERAYYVATADGGEYSADPGDYWAAADSDPLGGALARRSHPWRTATGRTVYAPRLIISAATVGHLRRLEAAARRMAGANAPVGVAG
jgi:hypothetical protein